MSLLQVNNLGKSFREYRSEWHRFARWFGLPVKRHTEHWVLRHISFEISAGEAVGIVGQNGAGKSTLLKMITGTLHPSEGATQINGRISAILELGMGFNPELSGRENAKHASGLMGFGADQIQAAMPDIEAFAEIGEYFDEPVRTYSSGMQMRVAFAMATAWPPEILIVDEALSVGDADFQHKCFKRIKEFQEMGTSLLIVSHDRSAILGLCSRAILLEDGVTIKDGDPEEVFDYYNAIISDKEKNTVNVSMTKDGKAKTKSGSGKATISKISLRNSSLQVSNFFGVGEKIYMKLEIDVKANIDNLVVGYAIKDRLGQTIFGTNTNYTNQIILIAKEGDTFYIDIEFLAHLGVGNYSIATALHSGQNHLGSNYEWVDLAEVFHVVNSNKNEFIGCAWIEPSIKVSQL